MGLFGRRTCTNWPTSLIIGFVARTDFVFEFPFFRRTAPTNTPKNHFPRHSLSVGLFVWLGFFAHALALRTLNANDRAHDLLKIVEDGECRLLTSGQNEMAKHTININMQHCIRVARRMRCFETAFMCKQSPRSRCSADRTRSTQPLPEREKYDQCGNCSICFS